jgi:hypothetical protein
LHLCLWSTSHPITCIFLHGYHMQLLLQGLEGSFSIRKRLQSAYLLWVGSVVLQCLWLQLWILVVGTQTKESPQPVFMLCILLCVILKFFYHHTTVWVWLCMIELFKWKEVSLLYQSHYVFYCLWPSLGVYE